MPSNEILRLPGRRCSRLPFRRVLAAAAGNRIRRSRMAVMRAMFSSRLAVATVMVSPSPTMEARFSVPARRPFSRAPPSIKILGRMPFLTYKAPTPLGAWNLWPERESISTPRALTSTGMWPTAWTASVWNQAPWAWAIAASSAMGCTVPISLFASMMETSAVSSRMAFSSSAGSTRPSGVTGR